MAVYVKSFGEHYMKVIIVFTWAYWVTKLIKNRVPGKSNTGLLKYSLYSSYI